MGNVWYFVYDYEMRDVMSWIRQKRPADVSVGRFVFDSTLFCFDLWVNLVFFEGFS